METMEQGEAPRIGASIQANALMMFGTPAQQQKYLPEILRGEAMHGMGYSEPQGRLRSSRAAHQRGAGRRALGHQRPEDLDHDLVGQIHVSCGPYRQERQPPHAGISMFIVPMNTPGITISRRARCTTARLPTSSTMTFASPWKTSSARSMAAGRF
jgi:alkylation response protein AidB-like acyl-CoA dehydrogenase